jgi:hypothetical protein
MLRDRGRRGKGPVSLHYFDSSSSGRLLARLMGWTVRARLQRLEFTYFEITDEFGMPVWLRITTQDMAQVVEYAQEQDLFQEALKASDDQPRMSIFLSKSLSPSFHPPQHGTTERALYLIEISSWETRRTHPPESAPVVFLDHTPWMGAVAPYAANHNITLVPVSRSQNLRSVIRGKLSLGLASTLRLIRYRRTWGSPKELGRKLFSGNAKGTEAGFESSVPPSGAKAEPDTAPRIAVEYFGQLNLLDAERQSNLAFWQRSELKGDDLLVLFTTPVCRLDEKVQAELDHFQISALVTHPGATTLPGAPHFYAPPYHNSGRGRRARSASLDSRWMDERVSEYKRHRDHWTKLFTAQDVKIFVGYNKIDPAYCAVADALQSLGGITVNYHRSFETFGGPEASGSADVMFNFSQTTVNSEIESGSTTPYHVITGFLGDHRFPMFRDEALKIRESLRSNGAEHVFSYFDENSTEDGRWRISNRDTQENYEFLLQKLLSVPSFGLVIKPKVPSTLRPRLGPIANLLEQAEATGRCFVFEAGGIQGWHPPSAAAMASDFAVHGHLFAGTAGLEAALTGTPTLLVDREGVPQNPLYQLGEGRVVFRSWDALWEACLSHWSNSNGSGMLGDWSHMINDLDPFQDGHASERMGAYVQELLEGLRDGKDRETVLAEAAERYRDHWGEDKVVQPYRENRTAVPASQSADLGLV